MKKILLSSIILFLFSASIVLFQISCKKEAVADVPISGTGVSNLGIILIAKPIKTSSYNYATELWIANYDGTNQKKVPINTPSDLPAGSNIETAQLSPDGKTVFIEYFRYPSGSSIYSCSLDGSNLKRITGSNTLQDSTKLLGVY